MNSIEKFSITRVTLEGKEETEKLVTTERPLTIIFNNQELVTLLCSSENLKYLAIGFLASEGLVKSKEDIKKITIDERRSVVRVETAQDQEYAEELVFKRFITTGCGRGATFYSAADANEQHKVESQTRVSASTIFTLVREFLHRSQVYKATGGVHSAALCDSASIEIFAEDIGRHNAVDKIFGQCLLEGKTTNDHLMITTGRVSSEILLKVARRNIPVLISKSAPTDLGVKLANELGITLIGFVRGKKMNVYTNDWRVTVDGKQV